MICLTNVNLLEIKKDDIPNLTFLSRIRPKRHTNQLISVEISNIITNNEVLNISSEDEMEEMEEISIESEEESADEFSNIFEDYSSPNYNLDELIDLKSTNNNSYLWILLWIMSFHIKFNLPETATESIRPKRHTNQLISVEISNIITNNEVLNISSEDEMEEMEEISIESEEESADEFSNIFEDYSSPNYNLDELIDLKSTNNNSYLWILLWIMSFHIKFNLPETATESLIKFIKLLLSEIDNSEFDTFPNSIYMTKKELGLRNDFYFFPICPKCHKLYNKQEVKDYKENDINSIMKFLTMNRFKLKFKLVYPFTGIRQQLISFYNHIYDGQIWKSFKETNDENLPNFFQNETVDSYLGLMINLDWFQPYDGTIHSTGVIYAAIYNCPNGKKIWAALILVSYDVPTARKICERLYLIPDVSCHQCEKKVNYKNQQHNFTGINNIDNWFIAKDLSKHLENALRWKGCNSNSARKKFTKVIVKQIWVDMRVLSSNNLNNIQKKMNEFQVSVDLGRIPGKIYCGEGFSNFTADQ
ncbi:hypothetical protein Glove_134g25 [Diversispora epigaea]|uniref:Uncharacterized protein n=1 Tax=Diversispora epigaea TaxID=1348612 RepID=A0A397J3E4_9GLOM|nr:hypothetical protein Glove_134g25 [Diversispora epigaea]